MIKKIILLSCVTALFTSTTFSSEKWFSTEAEYVRIEHYETSNRYVIFYKDCSSCRIKETTINPEATIRINTVKSNIQVLFEKRFEFSGVMGISIDPSNGSAMSIGVNAVSL